MIKKFDKFVNETFGMDLPKGSDPITEKDSDSIMAKSQLNRTKEFADMLIPIIDQMDDMEPWVQAKITKAEDYLNAVLNYYKGKDGVNEASRGVIHKAAKKGSYPVSIVVIRDGKVIAQELVKTPAEVPAAFNVIQSYHKHKGATVHIESKTGERLFSESLDEAVLDEFVVTEAKNTIGLAFKEEQDYLDFVEFIKDEKGSIKKDFGWDSKTKSWEVIMDVKVLDRIYGEGTPGNKESGWYGGLPGDFESVIIESVVTEAKKFYKTKDIVKMAKIAGDIVLDAKDDIQYLSVAYGDRVPAKELEKVLNNYDLDLEDVMESVVNEGKVTKKSISKASDDLAKIIIELKDNLGKLQKSKTDEERAKYIEIAKDLTIKRKDASESLNLAIAKLDKNAELDLSGKD